MAEPAPASPMARMRQRRAAAGLCRECGAPALSRSFCDRHLALWRRRYYRLRGYGVAEATRLALEYRRRLDPRPCPACRGAGHRLWYEPAPRDWELYACRSCRGTGRRGPWPGRVDGEPGASACHG